MPKSATSRAKRPTKQTKAKTNTKTTAKNSAARTARSRQVSSQIGARDFTSSALLAEFFGTLLLVSAMIITSGNQLLIGLSLIAIAAVFMGISGVNFNPAVTFGLWAVRKISATKMVVYWVAQFLGAIAAFLILHAFAHANVGIDLSSFLSFSWAIFALEAIGTAVFMLLFMAAVEQKQGVIAKATTMGLGFFIALIISTGYLAQAAQNSSASVATSTKDQPRISKVSSAVLNPAAALVVTENDNSQSMLTQSSSQDQTQPSRFTLETILGPLLGALVGANLFRLLNSQRKEEVL